MKTDSLHDCPDEETLAAFFDGQLPPAQADALHAQLVGCPDCARLVAALGLVLETDTDAAWARAHVPTAVTRRAMDLWPADPDPLIRSMTLALRWLGGALAPLRDALQPMPQMAMAVRGGESASETFEELRYQVTIGDVPLEIDIEVDGPDQVALSIRPVSAPPSGLLVRLQTEGETRALSSLTAAGASLPALPVGDYRISLEQAGQPLGELALALET